MSVIPQHIFSRQSRGRKQVMTQKWLELSPRPLESLPGPLPQSFQAHREAAGKRCEHRCKCTKLYAQTPHLSGLRPAPLPQSLRGTPFPDPQQGTYEASAVAKDNPSANSLRQAQRREVACFQATARASKPGVQLLVHPSPCVTLKALSKL